MSFDSVSIPGSDRTPRQSQPAEGSNGFFDFLEGVGKGAAVKPAAGLLQIADKALGGLYDIQENRLDGKIVSKAQEETTSIWENGGQMVGMIAPFMLARGGARIAGARISSAVEASRFAAVAPKLSPVAVSALEQGATGFSLGFVMPRNHESGFWGDRFKSGAVDGATFMFLGARMHGLNNRAAANLASELTLGSRILSGVKVGGRSGFEAGLLHAQLDANINGKLFNSPTAYLYDGTGFAAFGALAGAAEGALRRPAGTPAGAQTEAPAIRAQSEAPAAARATNGETQPITASRTVQASEEIPLVSRQGSGQPSEIAPPAAAKSEKVINYNARAELGGGDEGTVYSNGDGTATKVFHKDDVDVNAVKSMFDRLRNIGMNLPEITEVGKTAAGKPAIRVQQIGDGDSLRMQVMLGQIPRSEMPALREQYWATADLLSKHGIRIDWNLKNMRWEDGKLWFLDPSFLKNEPMGDTIVQMMSGSIGPRP